ncbi:hypothetical protein BGX27_000732 [Mortierella sp. AM989]|nr:hypothetical protein BGX27_000732 [Mortierella sp. AM989]
MTNTAENKPSTVEIIKDKAANLVSKVTGKSHGTTTHDPAHPVHAESHGQHHDQAHTHLPGQHHDQTHTQVPGQAHTHLPSQHHDQVHTQVPGQHHDQAHAQVPGQHPVHGQVNPSAFLSSVRFPHDNANASSAHHDGVTRPDAIHDPNHHTATHIPTHGNNAGVAAAAGAAGTEAAHHHHNHEGEHGHGHGYHKVDDPQRGVISRVVGQPGDPNNVGPSALGKPTM